MNHSTTRHKKQPAKIRRGRTQKSGKPATSTKGQNTAQSYTDTKSVQRFCVDSGQLLTSQLGALVGELSYAISTANPKTRARSTRVAMSMARTARQLCQNLKFVAGIPDLEPKCLDLSQLILDALEWLEPQFQMQDIEVVAKMDSPILATVDRTAFQHAVMNLFLTAKRRMPIGGKLHIKLNLKQNQVEFAAQCECASPQTKQSRDEQTQWENPIDTIALPVTQAILEAHGATVRFESQDPTFEFSFEMPVEKQDGIDAHISRRRSPRVKVQLPIELEVDGIVSHGIARILSAHGAFIAVHNHDPLEHIKPGLTGQATLYYYKNESIQVAFRTVVTHWDGESPSVAVEFEKLSNKAQRLLRSISYPR